ncbi:MAG: hypothetical protein D6813_14905 [Calditrichaeota bacterium]|nr:MAG: hypothetical protein D6813_14905 [Calditrichota bacterium]
MTLARKIVLLLSFIFLLVIIRIIFWPHKTELTWQEADGYRWANLKVPKNKKTGFISLPDKKTHIDFSNTLSKELIVKNRHLLNGSGVALGDVDGDGWVDIYFCRLEGPNVLYKNLGNWKFVDITEKAGVACANQYSTGAAFADIDGDGDLDLLVTALGGPNACFLNDGTGHFTDFTNESGIRSTTGSTTLALADADGDGDLDLYITNYKKQTVRDLYPLYERTIDRTVRKVGDTYEVLPQFKKHYKVNVRGNILERFEYAEPDMFFLNDGKGHFQPVSFTGGRFLDEKGNPLREPFTDWGLSVRFQDIDNDGDPDLYICNDFESPDRIWLNDGKGKFRLLPWYSLRHTSASSMGVDFSDIDRDGDMDFFVTEMLSRNYQRRKSQMGLTPLTPVTIGQIGNRPQYMRNTLFINRGDQTFADIAHYAHVEASEWSWTPLFLDVDLDGYEDLLISTGHFYDAMDSDTRFHLKTMSPVEYNKLQSEVFAYPNLELPNFIFRNKGEWHFEDVSQDWGFHTIDVSHGMALGDLDNDGDLDLVINRLNASALIYKNVTDAPRIAVRLHGLPPNTRGIGARIKVSGGPVAQIKEVICGGSYLSCSDPTYSFAAFDNERELTIEVFWPNGQYSVVEGARANRIYEIYQNRATNGTDSKWTPSDTLKPYFQEVSHLINHFHHEEPFDDFKRQPLLPWRLSQLGPGIAWFDLDDDKDEDLIITSGRGGTPAIYLNKGKGKFTKFKHSLLQRAPLDQTAVVAWSEKPGESHILIGNSNFESTKKDDSYLTHFKFNGKSLQILHSFKFGEASLGPLAMADYDNDGDLDLFVGGRTAPGRYPQPVSSKLYLNENGQFILDESNSKILKNIGLVSGAVFSDIDNDSDPDLLLSLKWGPVTLLRNQNGQFENVTGFFGLDQYTGWWNGITTGDFNEDGRLDIVATNWGLNTRYRASPEHPVKIYYSDFDNNGTLDILEAYFEPALQDFVPLRGFSALSLAMPFIRFKISSFKKFAESTLDEILGFRLKQADEVQATTLASMIFINRGDSFEAKPLPKEAQISPAFHVSVADFDNDGHEDLFLSQNFFAYQIETSRSDAGRGLWLKGDGRGHFQAVPGHISGVKVYGEQRGAAVGDYDGDARVDLVISQNGSQTKFYRNTRAPQGVRVRLVGPPGNIKGIGAQVQLIYKDGKGPVREIHGGSGYWSQDSIVPVLGKNAKPMAVRVRWPDGSVSEKALKENQIEIVVNYSEH